MAESGQNRTERATPKRKEEARRKGQVALSRDAAAAAGILVENLGAGDVRRHQVRSELDALELEIEDVGERPDQERLRQPGHAGDEAVASGEQRDQHLIDDVVLPDDDLAQFAQDAIASFSDALDAGGFRVRGGIQECPSWAGSLSGQRIFRPDMLNASMNTPLR